MLAGISEHGGAIFLEDDEEGGANSDTFIPFGLVGRSVHKAYSSTLMMRQQFGTYLPDYTASHPGRQ